MRKVILEQIDLRRGRKGRGLKAAEPTERCVRTLTVGTHQVPNALMAALAGAHAFAEEPSLGGAFELIETRSDATLHLMHAKHIRSGADQPSSAGEHNAMHGQRACLMPDTTPKKLRRPSGIVPKQRAEVICVHVLPMFTELNLVVFTVASFM